MDALNKNRRKSRDEEKLRYITRYSVYLDGRTVCPLAVDSDNRMSEVDSDDMDYDSPSSSYTTQSRESGDVSFSVEPIPENSNAPSRKILDEKELSYVSEEAKELVNVVQKTDAPLLFGENIYFRKQKPSRSRHYKMRAFNVKNAAKCQSFGGYDNEVVRKPVVAYRKKIRKLNATDSNCCTLDNLMPTTSSSYSGYAPLAMCEDLSVSSSSFEVESITSAKSSVPKQASNLSVAEYGNDDDDGDDALLPLRSLAKYIVNDVVVPNALKHFSNCSLDKWINIPLNNNMSSSKFSTSSSSYHDTSLYEDCRNQNIAELTNDEISFLNSTKDDDNLTNISEGLIKEANNSDFNTRSLLHENLQATHESEFSLPVSTVNEGFNLQLNGRDYLIFSPMEYASSWAFEDGRNSLLSETVHDLPPINTSTMQKQQLRCSMEVDEVCRQKLFAPELDDTTLRNFCSPPYPSGQYGGAIILPREDFADTRQKHLENLRLICAREEARLKPRQEDEGSDSKFSYFAAATLRELASHCYLENSMQKKRDSSHQLASATGCDNADKQQAPHWSERLCFATVHKGEQKLEKAEDVWLIYKEVPLTEDVPESPLEDKCSVSKSADNVLACPNCPIQTPSLPSLRPSTMLNEFDASQLHCKTANNSLRTVMSPDEHLHLSNISDGVELFKSKLELDLLKGRDKHKSHHRRRETDIDAADAELTANEYSVTANASSINISATSSKKNMKNATRSQSVSIYCQFKKKDEIFSSSNLIAVHSSQATVQDKLDGSDSSTLGSRRLKAMDLRYRGSGDATNSHEADVSCQSSKDKTAKKCKRLHFRRSFSSSLCSCWGRLPTSNDSSHDRASTPLSKDQHCNKGASDVEQLQSPLAGCRQPAKPPGVMFRRKQYRALHKRQESSRMESVLEEREGDEGQVSVSMPALPVTTAMSSLASKTSHNRRISIWKKKRDHAKLKQELAKASVNFADWNERENDRVVFPNPCIGDLNTNAPPVYHLSPDPVTKAGGHVSATRECRGRNVLSDILRATGLHRL